MQWLFLKELETKCAFFLTTWSIENLFDEIISLMLLSSLSIQTQTKNQMKKLKRTRMHTTHFQLLNQQPLTLVANQSYQSEHWMMMWQEVMSLKQISSLKANMILTFTIPLHLNTQQKIERWFLAMSMNSNGWTKLRKTQNSLSLTEMIKQLSNLSLKSLFSNFDNQRIKLKRFKNW